MAQSITLTASMRSNLASLKSIQTQMDSTQEKLSTGKKVNSAIDNASSYYQSRALTNRASDLDALLDSMGQGIQTIQAANEGIEAVTSYVEQLKSVAESAYALDPTAEGYDNSIASYQKQFDSIMNEINKLVSDASYQGVNLLKGGKLTVTFNETRSNKFDIQGEDIVTNMGINKAADWAYVGGAAAKVGAETTVKEAVTIAAGAAQFEDDASKKFAQASDGKYYYVDDKTAVPDDKLPGSASGTVADEVEVSAAVKVAADTELYTLDGATIAKADDGNWYNMATNAYVGDDAAVAAKEAKMAGGSYAASIDASITEISQATDYLRSYATTLGNNYSIIETRQNFTESLIDVLETGSDNLVLADMNEESANYLALQTRQQLAINSLSLASQSAQSVLSLFQ